MLERACLFTLAVVISLITVVALAGHGPFAGHVLVSLTTNHGIDEGDVPVALGWLVSMVCLWSLWRRLPSDTSSEQDRSAG